MKQWPNLGLFGEFEKCVDDIISAINENFFILDVLVQASFKGLVADSSFLPVSPLEGDVYINLATKDVTVYKDSEWITIQSQVGWFVYIQTMNAFYYFDGTNWKYFNDLFISSIGSSTDNAIVRFDGTTGKFIQNSLVIIDDAGNITGVNNISAVNVNLDGVSLLRTIHKVHGSYTAPLLISPGFGIPAMELRQETFVFCVGNSGPQDMTAVNPQIPNGLFPGQMITIMTTSPANTVKFGQGNGLETGGSTLLMGERSTSKFMWDNEKWVLLFTNGL